MVDWACVNGMAEEYGMGDPDMDVHDPAGHCGGGAGQLLYNAAYHGSQRSSTYRSVTCKFCGKVGLRWQEQQQWALVDAKGAIHFCRGSATPDEFEDLGQV